MDSEIDQLLFWQTKTAGTCHTAAKFMPLWKSALEVAPSPMKATLTTSSPLRRAA